MVSLGFITLAAGRKLIDGIVSMGCKTISLGGGFPTAEEVHWYGSGSHQCHHHFVVLVKSVVERVENQGEHTVWIIVGQPCSHISGQTLIQSLEESTDLIWITP